jgi:hypothetical protein
MMIERTQGFLKQHHLYYHLSKKAGVGDFPHSYP